MGININLPVVSATRIDAVITGEDVLLVAHDKDGKVFGLEVDRAALQRALDSCPQISVRVADHPTSAWQEGEPDLPPNKQGLHVGSKSEPFVWGGLGRNSGGAK